MNRLLSLFTLPFLLLGSAASAQTPSVITFNADWTIAASGQLLEGGQVQVAYDVNRLPDCRTTLPDGSPSWSITGHYRINGGPPGSFDLAGLPTTGAPPVIPLPTPGTLELWFKVSGDNCERYDSHYGTNFPFTIHPLNPSAPATILFQEGWVEFVVGTLKQGQPFVIDFDLDRLPECRLLYNGAPTWDVGVRYRFNNGVYGEKSVTQVSGYSRTGTPVTIIPPAGASSVSVWFENWDRGSCRRWDSNLGANYHFSLQP
ncbi:DUF6209 family protein [Pyxidicoccus xibeiensis]|uniref:DUF6209 family protein n=1 Tax=Pyxidicoccus xibeiensis TaxID=2906759 RepID=UPI0020A8049C|nr:DUF6209 family protein [Pyxidicoccus xibeiensis]MCP3138050.1 DUF6209 family protein [Pyxidicoccus xibeiensis]